MPESHNIENCKRRDRSRSRSPRHESHSERKHKSSRRSRSPRRDDDRHRRKKHRSRSPIAPPVTLPYKAKPLSKHKFDEYRPLFQSYLDIQKSIQLDDLDEREARGRWKSFTSRWNRGDLARSWYDPSMLKTAQETVQQYRAAPPRPAKRASPEYEKRADAGVDADAQSDSDDDFGPAPPTQVARQAGHGPTIPKLDDLTYRNEMRDEEGARDQSSYVDDIRFERKQDRKAQKDRLEELVPRADPGSRERQLEKKHETTSALHSFRDAKEAGDVEVGESELMGDDGIDEYKKKKQEGERQKNEREIRKEEIMRAKAAERDERLSERRAKESQTMDFLRQIAKERYG